jgi:hypothetical protein
MGFSYRFIYVAEEELDSIITFLHDKTSKKHLVEKYDKIKQQLNGDVTRIREAVSSGMVLSASPSHGAKKTYPKTVKATSLQDSKSMEKLKKKGKKFDGNDSMDMYGCADGDLDMLHSSDITVINKSMEDMHCVDNLRKNMEVQSVSKVSGKDMKSKLQKDAKSKEKTQSNSSFAGNMNKMMKSPTANYHNQSIAYDQMQQNSFGIDGAADYFNQSLDSSVDFGRFVYSNDLHYHSQ